MQKIKKDYYWALPLIKSIKRSKDTNRAHFSNEINFINYLTNIFEVSTEFLEKPLLKSNNLQFKENFWLLKHEKILNKEEIKLLLNNLGIFPEQYFSFDATENTEGINISHEFYYRNSQTNDKIFAFDKKTKSTKESIGVCARVKRSLREKQEKSININESLPINNIYEYKNNTILGMMQINQSLIDENEEIENNKRKIQNLHHYKLITDVIEKHFENNKHPLFVIKKKFLEFFTKFYKELSMEVKFLEDIEKKKKYQRAIYEDSFYDLQRFLKILQETTALYYNLYSYKNFMSPPYFFCKDNLLNFITSLMFSKTEVYDLLLELQIQQDFETESQIETNLQKYELLPIEEFKIPMKFCLDLKKIGLEKTEENSNNFANINKNRNHTKQNSMFPINSSSPSNSIENLAGFEKYHSKTANLTPVSEENIHKSSLFRTISLCPCNFKNHRMNLNFDENFQNLGKNILKRSNFLQKKSKTKKFESEGHIDDSEAYSKAINNLKKIEKIKSPILKLKNIIKTSVLIIEEIKHFYEENKIEMEFHIESDDILSIFIYICAKAHVKYLYSQCKLTEKFLSNKIANSISGYYLITLMASVSFFAEKK